MDGKSYRNSTERVLLTARCKLGGGGRGVLEEGGRIEGRRGGEVEE